MKELSERLKKVGMQSRKEQKTGDAAWKAVKEPVMDEIKKFTEAIKKKNFGQKLFCIWTLSLIPKKEKRKI